MAHSHLILRHLMRQWKNRTATLQTGRNLPEWLQQLAHEVSSEFVPLSGVGRVGYSTEWRDGHWELRTYMGRNEVLGGPDDGIQKTPAFEFNVQKLMNLFDVVHGLQWCVSSSHGGSSRSFLQLDGMLHGEVVRVKIYSQPPDNMSPALQVTPCGAVKMLDLEPFGF